MPRSRKPLNQSNSTLSIEPHPYHHSWQKRFFDITLSSFLLVTLSPLLLVITAAVGITAGWPIIFTQQRTGLHKKPFTILKFRTMYLDAHKHQKKFADLNQAPLPMFKIEKDPRFVGCGTWLSRTGLDELPQLVNILRGEMSFVGPRPLPVAEAKKLDSSWDFRYLVKPGIFSEWSVEMKNHRSLKKWLELEKMTVQNGGIVNSIYTSSRTLLAILFNNLADVRNVFIRQFRV